MLARGARSLGQGALVAAFTLYLQALGWSASAIGATLSGALLVGATLTLVIGPLSDRAGRRRFLLGYEALQAAAALLTAPFFVAAVLQAVYLVLYARFFRRYAGGGIE